MPSRSIKSNCDNGRGRKGSVSRSILAFIEGVDPRMWDYRPAIVSIVRTPKNPSFSSRKSTSQSVHYPARTCTRTRIGQQDQDRGRGERKET